MKKIPIQEYAYANPVSTGVGAKNTISNGPDDGTNNLLASHFWQPMRHGTTQQAISNGLTALTVEKASSTGELNIGGHGNEGLLETGMGQTGPFDTGRIILTWNESAWGPELDRIKPAPTTQISIWSCHTGAGQDGADLLFAMAKRCGRAVRAGTGFLYSNNQSTWWENGSVWQVATPTSKPAPIAAPSPHGIMAQTVRFDHEGREFDAGDVKELEVTPRPFGARSAQPAKRLEGSVAQEAVTSLFLSPAMDMDVSIAGMITASIRLTFSNSASITFDVYNDRLAVNRASRTGYYIRSSLRSFYDLVG